MSVDPDNLKRLALEAKDAPAGRRDGGRAHVAFRDAATPDVVLELLRDIDDAERALGVGGIKLIRELKSSLSAQDKQVDTLRERVATQGAELDRAYDERDRLRIEATGLAARVAALEAELASACDRCQDRIAERRERRED